MRKAFLTPLLVLLPLIGACTYAGGQPTGPDGLPTRFGALTSCEPANWVGLEQDSRSLPPAERERVDMLLNDARGYYSDGDRGHCIIALQKVESLIRSGRS